MKILESPAKLMRLDRSTEFLKTTKPQFIDEATQIQQHLKEKNPKFLQDLMKISNDLAQENWERNQIWSAKPSAKESSQALFTFDGQVYKGMDAPSLNKKELQYLQKNLRIISGLYGMLKPSDKIMLYRLEMGSGFHFDDYKNLYDFWRERLTLQLDKELKSKDFVLNLASQEYAKAIDFKQLKVPVITAKFQEKKEGKYKTIMVYAKTARGLLARYCAQNEVETIEKLKGFNLEHYIFNDQLSTDKTFVFTR